MLLWERGNNIIDQNIFVAKSENEDKLRNWITEIARFRDGSIELCKVVSLFDCIIERDQFFGGRGYQV